jgi:hypothetical protein
VIGQLLRRSGFYSIRQHHLSDQPRQRLAIKGIATRQIPVKPSRLGVRLVSLSRAARGNTYPRKPRSPRNSQPSQSPPYFHSHSGGEAGMIV